MVPNCEIYHNWSRAQFAFIFRFPKPDLRPPSNLKKTPWWRKDIQKESLTFLITGGEFKTTIHSIQGTSSYEILFKKTKGNIKSLLM